MRPVLDNFSLTDPGPQLVTILLGILVLTLGRKLFWLAVGVVGFVAGLGLAIQLMSDQPDWLILIVALIAGLIGAILAIFLQQIAVALAGFVMGAYASIWLLQLFELNLAGWDWLVFIGVGLLGALLALTLLDPALIVVSSLAGAILIVQATNFTPLIAGLLFLGLLAAGVLIQLWLWQGKSLSAPPQPPPPR